MVVLGASSRSQSSSLEVVERLRRLRQERGLTTGVLARLAQVDQSYVSRLEYGAHGPPSPRTVRRLALALGVGPDALAPGLVAPAGPEPPALVVLGEAGGLVEREQLLRWSSLGRRLYQAGFLVFRVAPEDREEVVQLVEELLVTLERDAPDVRRLRLQLIRGVLGLRGAERLEKTRRALEGAFPGP